MKDKNELNKKTREELLREIEELRMHLQEANDTLNAIRNGAVVVQQDITEMKTSEKMLRKSEETYRTLAQNIPGMIYRGNPDWSSEIISNCELVCGYSITEFRAHMANWTDIILPEDKERVSMEAAKLFEKKMSIVQEYRIIAKDGSMRWVEDHKTSLFSDEGIYTGVDGVVFDITERKRMENMLRESEEKFRHLAEKIRDVFYIYTPDWSKALYVSPMFDEVFGCSREALYKNPSSFLDFIHPEDRERVISTLHETEKMGLDYDAEYRIVRSDGTIRWIYDRSFPVKNESGQFVYVVGIAKDISARKFAEEEKAQRRERLYQLQKYESAAIFAGGIAHNFNNILMAIMGYSDFLKDKHTDKETKDFVQKILRSEERAADLTRKILVFTGTHPGKEETLHLNNVIRETDDLLLSIIGTGIKFEFILTDKDCSIIADRNQIVESLVNLVKNAKDAMPEGGVLRIRTDIVEMDTVFIKAHNYGKPGRYALLSVSDTGVGMDDKTRARLFEPFFTTKGLATHTGLGLSTIYGIVRQHKGYIGVDNAPGKGSTFEIYLPKQ